MMCTERMKLSKFRARVSRLSRENRVFRKERCTSVFPTLLRRIRGIHIRMYFRTNGKRSIIYVTFLSLRRYIAPLLTHFLSPFIAYIIVNDFRTAIEKEKGLRGNKYRRDGPSMQAPHGRYGL